MDTVRLANAIGTLWSHFGARVLVWPGVGLLFSTILLVDLGMSVMFAVPVTVGFLAVPIALGLRLVVSSQVGFPSANVQRTTLWGLLAWYVVGATVLLRFWPGFPLVLSAAIAATSALPTYRRFQRDLARAIHDRLTRPATLESMKDAQDMVEACRSRLAQPGLQQAQRVEVTVNLAHALVTLSMLSGSEDGLVETIHLIAPIVETGTGDPVTVFRATDELMAAMAVQAYKHGETQGVREARRLVLAAANRLPDDEFLAAQVQFTKAFWVGTDSAGSGEQARERAEALHRLQQLATAASSEQVRSYARLALAAILGQPGGSDDEIERAITLAREAAKGRLPKHWPLKPGMVLARLLHLRASRVGASVAADTEEAATLCVRGLDDEHPYAGTAALTLAEVLRLRDTLGLGALRRQVRYRGDAVDVPRAYRLAFDAFAKTSDFDPSQAANAWADWAIEHDDVQEAAEALWRLSTVIRTESARRLTRVGRERVAMSVQGTTAEAGHWLARAGRLRDAVVAMECGRAILLGGPARYVDPNVPHALAARGRHDLWQRWLDAVAHLEALHRAQYASHGTTDRRSSHLPREMASSELMAWSAYDQATHAIARTLGRRPDGVPSYEDLRHAATGTVVAYLGSARRAGDALILGLAEEPLHIRLPDLSAAHVADRAGRLVRERSTAQGRSEQWRRVLSETLDWLAEVAVGPLLPHLPLGADVVLVPTGLLGLLPLHAAPAPEHAGRPDARPAFLVRYAPNVRVDSMARRLAARFAGATHSIAAVSACHPPGQPPLEWAEVEASGLDHLYGVACTSVLNATRDNTISALRRAAIWHLACHGVSRPDRPLDSAILLDDGSLTLREMFTWPPGEHRLAVLSACTTSVPDDGLLDEVVSLPAALLRAGVAGVVASQWPVEDRATAVLMLRFHTLLREGIAPGRALAGAQEWLRTATNDRLQRAYPELISPPPSLPASAQAQWQRQVPYRDAEHWAAFCLTGT